MKLRTLPEWTPERLAERYRAGVALRALCTETGLSYGTVHLRLQRVGVTMRPRGGFSPRVVKAPADKVD